LPFDPERYRKEKEREIAQVYGTMRKRSFKFLFLNVLIVILVFVFLFFVRNVSPQTYSNITDSLQLTIELTKLEYIAPDRLGAKVYLVNTKKTDKQFTISDFYFKIYNDSSTVYEFTYTNTKEGTVNALSKRLIFNLEDQVYLTNLKDGTYTVYSRCKVNGKRVEVYRTFTYSEEVIYGILTEPYYLVGEDVKPKVYIINRTSKSISSEISKIVWSFEEGERTQVLYEKFTLYPSNTHVVNSEFSFKIQSFKNFELGARLYLSDGSIKEVRTLIPVAKAHEIAPTNLDFSLEVEEPILINKAPNVRMYVVNKINRERYIKVDKIQFSIPGIGYNFEINNRRLYCTAFGKTYLGKLEKLSFNNPGVYDLIITFWAGKTKIEKKLSLAVGK